LQVLHIADSDDFLAVLSACRAEREKRLNIRNPVNLADPVKNLKLVTHTPQPAPASPINRDFRYAPTRIKAPRAAPQAFP